MCEVVSRGIAWADESYKGGKVAGASSDAEYPKAHRWHRVASAISRCAAWYRIMMNKTLHPALFNFQEQEI